VRRVGKRLGFWLVIGLLAVTVPSLGVASSGEGHGKSEKGGAKNEAGKAENGAIAIGPLVVNVLSNKGYRYFRLALNVQCADNAAAERLVKPDAREGLVFLLSSKLAEDLLTPAGKMALRKDLVTLFDKYAGADTVKGVYFSEFVFQ